MKKLPKTPAAALVLEELEQSETLRRHGLAQNPIAGAKMICPKCQGWPMLVLPHDNSDPAALHIQCAKCGTQFRALPPKQDTSALRGKLEELLRQSRPRS
jgi:Zn ribbon nucleic-acid-binding protein